MPKVLNEATNVANTAKNAKQYGLDKFWTLLNFGHHEIRTYLISGTLLSEIKNVRNFW